MQQLRLKTIVFYYYFFLKEIYVSSEVFVKAVWGILLKLFI